MISVIMIDGGFREQVETVGSWLAQSLPDSAYELIWVEYTSNLNPTIAANPRIKSFALGLSDEPQVLARAFNFGIIQAQGEIIVLPDADVACGPQLLEVILAEHQVDNELVLYVLRLDQKQDDESGNYALDYLRATSTIKHTFNFGGCTIVRKQWLVNMNGYESLPFMAGYHYNGGDNYIRFKNMGLKIRWHPTQRVYHPWHDLPGKEKFQTVPLQEQLIKWRAASWDWLAFEGLDASRNRDFEQRSPIQGWSSVTTEYGPLANSPAPGTSGGASIPPSGFRRLAVLLRDKGLFRGSFVLMGKILAKLTRGN